MAGMVLLFLVTLFTSKASNWALSALSSLRYFLRHKLSLCLLLKKVVNKL